MSYNILIAAWGGPGHLGPMLTAACQLRRHGHNVRFISRADARTDVASAGFGFATWQRTPSISPIARGQDGLPYAYDHLLFGPAAARAADTREEIARTPTDALLSDSALFGSTMAAEAAGIPCALLSPTISLRPLPGAPPLGSCLPAPRTTEDRSIVEAATVQFTAVMNKWLPMLNDARASQGLPPLDCTLQLFDRAERLLLAMSAAFDFAADYLPKNVRYIGPLLDSSNWSKPWVAPWPARLGRPRVLVSFSTTNQGQAGALQRAINAVAQAGMDGVATVGPALDTATFDAPKNVTLLPSAPHDAVMKEVSLVVAHAGHGTVSRALWHGRPLLVMPMGRDQNDVALRVEAHGAGLILPAGASETEIAGALWRLANEPQFGLAARRLGEAITFDITRERLVSEIEGIVSAYRQE
ncbi:MAG TPA: glycosyltransferase [Hyphomicrobiaceae bacterium]|nr:glycosyltransferase [Hyphomicrobiaceae bacterium]